MTTDADQEPVAEQARNSPGADALYVMLSILPALFVAAVGVGLAARLVRWAAGC